MTAISSEAVAGLVERLEVADRCPFCSRDPYHYADIGVGFERVAVTCCELGIALIQDGDELLMKEVELRREAAATLTALSTRLSEQEAEVGKLRAALEPFAKACDDACDETCADELTANHTGITMGDLRRARQAHGGANAS